LILVSSTLGSLSSRAHAEIIWSTTEQRLLAGPGQKSATAVFKFTVTGTPVHIVAIRPGCDCLSAKPVKELWNPGESGQIEVDFSFRGQTGKQIRTVEVDLSDAPKRPIVLSLTAVIPEEVQIYPRILVWNVGSPKEAKSVEVKFRQPKDAKLLGVHSKGSAFSVKVEKGGDGGSSIEVTPLDPGKQAKETLQVEVSVGGEVSTFLVYASVK